MLRVSPEALSSARACPAGPLAGFLKHNLPPLVMILIALAVKAWVVEPLHFGKLAAQSKQNLHAIQLALERFAADSPDGTYPVGIAELQQSGYMPRLPANPFTGAPMRAYGVAEAAPLGDFVYFPRYEPGGSKPSGYTLAAGNAPYIQEFQSREMARAALAAPAN